MHEALCRPTDTTLDVLHVERRAADHSANMGSRSPATAGVNCPAYAAPEAVPDDRRRRAFGRGAHPVGYCDWSKCFSFASIFWASATALSSWSLTLAVMSSSSAAN